MDASRTLRIAVVGGGPAGATCAARLAAGGMKVDLFEAQPTGEKPCGGGIPGAALREFPALLDPSLPRRVVTSISVESPAGLEVELPASEGVHIFSRREMDSFLREKARQAGARVVETTVRGVARAPSRHWTLETDDGPAGGYDFLVGADGVRGIVRRALLGRPPEESLTLARYAYVASTDKEPGPVGKTGAATSPAPPEPGAPGKAGAPPAPGVARKSGTIGAATILGVADPGSSLQTPRNTEGQMALKFFPGSDGYLWVFPRRDHLSIGICATRGNASSTSLEGDLSLYMKERLLSAEERTASVKGYFIPAEQVPPATQGEGWALIGDAGGFVDPITREGIAPAMRSAETLAARLQAWNGRREALPGTPGLPPHLQRAHQYRGGFYGKGFTERMIRMASRSRAIRRVLGDLFGGSQGYLGLKRRLLLNALPCGLEMGLASLRGNRRSRQSRRAA